MIIFRKTKFLVWDFLTKKYDYISNHIFNKSIQQDEQEN